jgi:type I restriction enzyme M protein
MVRVIDPRVGETVYDPGCGTGGFLAQAFDHMRLGLGDAATAEQLRLLREETFWGREKADLIYPIALANLVLHVTAPDSWHGVRRSTGALAPTGTTPF